MHKYCIFIFLICLILFTNTLCSQPTHIAKLEKQVYDLNNELKYKESQFILQTFLAKKNITEEEKYYAYLFLSYTYKRLSDYKSNLEYLDKALAAGVKTNKKEFFTANITCQKALAYFDIQKYSKSKELMDQLESTNFAHINDENRAKIMMQQGYILMLYSQFKESEIKLNDAQLLLSKTSICDLPMILAKKMELYAKMNNFTAVKKNYHESIRYADSCKIIKYGIYTREILENIYIGKPEIKKELEELDSLRKVYKEEERLNELNVLGKKYQNMLKDQEILQQKKNAFYAKLITAITLLALIIISIMLFWVHKKKKIIAEQYDNIEHLIFSLSHDIKEPMLGISFLLSKIKSDDKNLDEASKSLNLQIKAVNDIVNNLLQIKKNDSDSKQFSSTAEIIDVIEKVNKNLEYKLKENQIKISVENKVGTNFSMNISKNRLYIILLNLLHNAVKHSPNGEEIKVYIEENGISIIDKGNGVDKNAEFDSDIKGTGLGLELCKKLLVKTNLSITLDNNKTHSGAIARLSNIKH